MSQITTPSAGQEVLPTLREVDATNMRDAVKRARLWPYVVFGLTMLLALIGGFGAWAVTARLDGAIIAAGQFAVEGERKTVQHLEGGIVREILVGEGDRVEQGEVLLRLDGTVDKASYAIVRNERQELEAQRSRLLSELRGADQLIFEAPSPGAEDAGRLREIREGQRELFKARLASRTAERRLREQRIKQLTDEIDGLQRQRSSNDKQIDLIDDELEGLRDLAKRKLVPRRRLLALQREAERIRGQSEALSVDIARARSSIDEIGLEALQAERGFREQVTTELRSIEPRITSLVERESAAALKLSLIDVRAPSDGYVVDLKTHTIGGVIRAGDKIMDIVPESASLILEARVTPVDIEKIKTGQSARVQLSAFDQSVTPEAVASVLSISADSLKDEKTGSDYYLARLRLGSDQPAPVSDLTLVPGMPATVFIQTGARTPMSYLVSPLSGRFSRIFAGG